MKKAIFLLMLCVGSFCTHAQHYFNQRNTLHSFFSVLQSVIPSNGRYYCGGMCWDSVNYVGGGQAIPYYGIKFAVFDEDGQKLIDTVYQKRYYIIETYASTMHRLADGNFIFASDDLDTNSRTRTLITVLDSLGRKVWDQQYANPFCQGDSNNFQRVKDFKQTTSGEWLLLTTVQCNAQENPDLLLTKLDSNFNIIWQKKYGDPNRTEIAGKLLIEQDGYVIGCGEDNSNVVFRNFTYQAKMIKVDTGGNELWTWKSDTAYKTNFIRDLIRTQDGGYVYCGSGMGSETSGLNASIYFRGWVEKIDANRNPVWHKVFNKDYSLSQFNVIRETSSGNFQLFGNNRIVIRLDSTRYQDQIRGWFLTINANGDSLSQRIYSGIAGYNFVNYFNDAKPTSDGGYIMVGESTDQSPTREAPVQRGWLVKVDSNGCVGPNDAQCWPLAIAQNPLITNETSIYPNPVTAQLNISYHNSSTTGAVFTLTDVTGKLLTSQTLPGKSGIEPVDVSRLASGIYLYRITESGVVTKQGKIVRQ